MKDFRSSIKGIAAVYRPFRWYVVLCVLTGLVNVAASIVFVWVCKCLVDIATGVLDKPLGDYVWLMILIVLLRIACNVAGSYWENFTQIKATNALRLRTFSHVMGSSWDVPEEFHSADVMNRIQEDIRVMVELVCTRIPDIIVTVCQLIAASVFLVLMAPGLLTLLIVLMLLGLIGSKMFYKTQRRLTDNIRKQDSESLEHVQESLQNRAMALSLSGFDRVKERFSSILDNLKATYIKRLNYTSIARGFIGFGFMAGYTTAFLWGIFGIRDGVVTYGMMTAFLQLVGQVQRPLAELSRHVPAFIQAMSSEERLSELESLPALALTDGPVLDEAPSLVFDNISFSYPGKSVPVFDGFSHTFNAGTLTVIMGSTGRGKSTLARLAMGLLRPGTGEVSFELADGRSSVAAIANFMYVPQGGSLLSGTVRENLTLAAPDADEDGMRHALHIAAADFVYDLPDGLDTRCGESGSCLSEGQAQRIAIARALLHPGTVLILDEATSALDSATEVVLLERLASEYRGSKTILMITHRECALTYADEILRLD